MKIINNYKYSSKEFPEYKIRIKTKFIVHEDYHNIDIYSDNPNVEEIKQVIKDNATRKVLSIEFLNVSTKEQDIATSKFIDEILKDE